MRRRPTAELICELLETLEAPPQRAPDSVLAPLRRELERLRLANEARGSCEPISTEREERPMTTLDVWTYREGINGRELVGYDVEALDGGIGSVDESSDDVGRSYIVVDTGPWVFGKKVMLPASVIDGVDHVAEKVWVTRTKDQIKNAPEFDEARYRDDAYRRELGRYYTRGAAPKREAR
jgi:hypothetical protein